MERYPSKTRKTAMAATCLTVGCAVSGLRAAPPVTLVENGTLLATIGLPAETLWDRYVKNEALAKPPRPHPASQSDAATREIAACLRADTHRQTLQRIDVFESLCINLSPWRDAIPLDRRSPPGEVGCVVLNEVMQEPLMNDGFAGWSTFRKERSRPRRAAPRTI